MSSKPRTRIRRTAKEAREEILRAAEKEFIRHGPSGLRLKEIARTVGISHPTVLHHFGSREQLVEAVVRKRIDDMKGEVLEALSGGMPSPEGVRAILDRLAELFGDGGHARVVAFLALGDELIRDEEGIRPIADALKTAREGVRAGGSRAEASGDPKHEPASADDVATGDEESYFIVLLIATALFGEALAGLLFRGGDAQAPSSEAFRRWIAELLEPRLRASREP